MNRNTSVNLSIVTFVLAVGVCAAQAQPPGAAAAAQCMADITQQVQSAMATHLGGSSDQLAAAYSDALEKAPSVGECVARRSSGGGGDPVTQSSTLSSNGPEQPLADAADDANKDKLSMTATFTNVKADPTPSPLPSPKKLALIGGVGAVAVGALVAHGGSSGGASPAPAAAAPATPTTPAPTPAPAPSGFSALTGTYVGQATLQAGAPSCAGATPSYDEKATVVMNDAGNGSITMSDTPGFNRTYSVNNLTPSGLSSQGTFTLAGLPVLGSLFGTFAGTTATLNEITNYGNCTNTYRSTLTKQ